MNLELKKSDVAAMAVSAAYQSGGKVPSAKTALEKTAYQVLGRIVAKNETYKSYAPDVAETKDAGTGVAAALDGYLRKGQGFKSAAMSGFQEAVASYAARKLMEMTNIEDGSLI